MKHLLNVTLTAIILLTSCSKPEKELSNSEKVIQAIEKELGKFDNVLYSKDSLSTTNMYNGNSIGRTKKAKNIIDKTLNLVGTEKNLKSLNEVSGAYSYGDYVWETPTEKISIRGYSKLGVGDTTSYLTIWVERK